MDRNLTILIVEDNADEALLLKLALYQAKINNPVQVVKDRAEAIDYLKGIKEFANRRKFPFPSVLILDLKLPRLSGFDVLGWLRDHRRYAIMPIIVLANSRHPEDIRRAYALGANSYIIKPPDLKDLIHVLRTAYEYWAICEKPPALAR